MKKWYIIGAVAGFLTAALAVIFNFKKILLYVITAGVLFLAVLGTAFEPAEKALPISNISEELHMDISMGTVERNQDTHGGFLGDGYCVVELSFSPEDGAVLLAEIQKSSAWNSLPLTENLIYALYGSDLSREKRSPYFDDENGEPFLPEVENGYYFFLDRHSQSLDSRDDSQLFSRASYNFTLAIFDTDTNTLHYFEMDT